MKKIIPIFLLAISGIFTRASSQESAIGQIPTELKDGMDAVTISENGEFEIQSLDRAKFVINRTITVLNSDGSHNAFLRFYYDKLVSVTSLSAAVYDSQGKKIKKVKKSDFKDESAISGGSFFDDSRELWYDLRQDAFPYTIEYQIEYLRKFTYGIPSWSFLRNVNESTMLSTFTIKSPEEYNPRYLTWKAKEPIVSNENGLITTKWSEEKLVGIDVEPYDANISELFPKVITAPSKFEYEGYVGDMSTWDGMAKWQLSLNQGRDNLSAETTNKIQKLTSGLSNDQKIKSVYEYVQSNTRYVSVQLGVGGLQPMPAKLVDEEGYGDCKALSFYTQSLLKSIGIESYYTKVYAGNNPSPINKEFPDHMSNHVILCVPNGADTVWLECTSQTSPFGFLGSFTSDREVFIITEDGGEIVKTPVYGIDDNYLHTKANVELFEDGNATISYKSTHSGLLYDGIRGMLNTGSTNQKKYLEKSIEIPSFILEDYKVEDIKKRMPSAKQEVSLVARNLTSKSGTRFFLQPNLLSKERFIPVKDDNRERPIHIRFSYAEVDTISYSLPENYNVEAMFEPVDYSSKFGSYHAELIKGENGKLIYIREHKRFKGVFEPELYADFVSFCKQVVRADKKRISFKKKT